MRVKIFGAGSIGNHLANASRVLGWDVIICDVDPLALERTRNMIYPGRYGQWDEKISLHLVEEAPKSGFDLIIIGTPPPTHMDLGILALNENPKAILIEKPFCTPDLRLAHEFYTRASEKKVDVFVGYDHVLSKGSCALVEKVKASNLKVTTLDVEFRESWSGIFAAHPWLDGPADTYLGYMAQGGGALSEHSHALNLWQHFSRQFGLGRVNKVQAAAKIHKDSTLHYDEASYLILQTDKGFVGRCVQDVITEPAEKIVKIGHSNGRLSLKLSPNLEKLEDLTPNSCSTSNFDKIRPDDFIIELKHLQTTLGQEEHDSPISAKYGLETNLVIAAAEKAIHTGKSVSINYANGYKPTSID